jgi:hypothetical protein
MGLASLPAVGEGEELGPVKSNRRAVNDSTKQSIATEWNALAARVVEYGEVIGLEDGSTPGSLEEKALSLDGRVEAVEVVAGLGPVVAEDHALAGGAAWGVDPSGRCAVLAKPNGTVWLKPSPETFRAIVGPSSEAARAVELGARGTVCMAGGSAELALLTYMGTAEGVLLPYVTRTASIEQPAHVLNTSSAIEVHIGYGQSWRTNEHPPSEMDAQPEADYLAALEAPQLDAFMMLGLPGDTAALPLRVSIAGSYVSVHDLIAVGDAPDANRVGIDRAAALAYGQLRTRDLTHRTPMVHLLAGWPGVTWDSLKPDAAPVGGNDENAWYYMLQQCATVAEIAALYGKTSLFRAVGWTHGGTEVAPGDYLTDLGEMTAAFDAEELNGASGADVHFFIDQNAAAVEVTEQRAGALDQVEFCRTNANGRSWMVGPRYPYAFRDTIHHTALGQAQYGELEALAKHTVLDGAGTWEPLWVTDVAIDGDEITVTTSAPYSGGLVVDATQIEQAPDDGWSCWDVVGAALLPISSVTYDGNVITITLSSTPTPGTVIEVGYAWRALDGVQPAGTVEAPSHSSCWGNVKMVGPESTLFSGKTIDAWLCAHAEEVTA